MDLTVKKYWLSILTLSVLFLLPAGLLAHQPQRLDDQGDYQLQAPELLKRSNRTKAGASSGYKPEDSAWQTHVFAGLSFDFPATGSLSSGNRDVSIDMAPTIGFFGEIDFPAHKYFAFGLRGHLKRWKVKDSDASGNYIFSLEGVPKLRYPFPTTPAALYIGVPVGLSFVFPPDTEGNVEYDMGYTWNLSVVGGFRFKLGSALGMFFEFGIKQHNIVAPVSETDREFDLSYTALGLNGGLVF